jgi:hypothetical protein
MAEMAIAWFLRFTQTLPTFDGIPFDPTWDNNPRTQPAHIATAISYRERPESATNPTQENRVHQVENQYTQKELERVLGLVANMAVAVSWISGTATFTIFEPSGTLAKHSESLKRTILRSTRLKRRIEVLAHPAPQTVQPSSSKSTLRIVLIGKMDVPSRLLPVRRITQSVTSNLDGQLDENAIDSMIVSAMIGSPRRPDLFISRQGKTHGFPLYALNGAVV